MRLPSSFVCSSCCVRSELLCSGRLCASLCASLCCPRRLRSDLLRSGSDLLQHRLQQLLQEVALLQDAKVPLPEDLPAQAEPLQGSWLRQRLQQLRSDLRCSSRLCSKLLRSSRLWPDLCRSSCLLPVV